MDISNTSSRLQEANKLLVEDQTSAEKLESLSVILKGLNPKLDQALTDCTKTLSKIEKLQSGDVVSLSAESLPEETEEQKKRKKAILAFIRTWEDLKSEFERVKLELTSSKDSQQQLQSAGRIAAFAKGPLGIITILATIVVGTMLLVNSTQQSKNLTYLQTGTPASALPTASPTTPSSAPTASPQPKQKVKVIIFNNKKIPLTELRIGSGPDCLDRESQVPHYHALNQTSAKALDGSFVPDPGGCGYGKTKEVAVVEE